MIKNSLNLSTLSEGFVLDHIEAGKSMEIYKHLKLDKLDCVVAIIKNASSKKMGKKDIIKIDTKLDVDLDIIGYVDPNITVNVIENGVRVEKKHLKLPNMLRDVIKCKNPRCITTTEQELAHVFKLCDPETRLYRCLYCEVAAK